jgi:hypothetical protein
MNIPTHRRIEKRWLPSIHLPLEEGIPGAALSASAMGTIRVDRSPAATSFTPTVRARRCSTRRSALLALYPRISAPAASKGLRWTVAAPLYGTRTRGRILGQTSAAGRKILPSTWQTPCLLRVESGAALSVSAMRARRVDRSPVATSFTPTVWERPCRLLR